MYIIHNFYRKLDFKEIITEVETSVTKNLTSLMSVNWDSGGEGGNTMEILFICGINVLNFFSTASSG